MILAQPYLLTVPKMSLQLLFLGSLEGSLEACSTFSWIGFSAPTVLSMSMDPSCAFSLHSQIFLQDAMSFTLFIYIILTACLPAGKVLHTRSFLQSQYRLSHQHAPMGSLGSLHALHAQLMPWSNAQPSDALGIIRIFSAHQVTTMVLHHFSSTQMTMPSAICSAVVPRKNSTCPLFLYFSLPFTALDL